MGGVAKSCPDVCSFGCLFVFCALSGGLSGPCFCPFGLILRPVMLVCWSYGKYIVNQKNIFFKIFAHRPTVPQLSYFSSGNRVCAIERQYRAKKCVGKKLAKSGQKTAKNRIWGAYHGSTASLRPLVRANDVQLGFKWNRGQNEDFGFSPFFWPKVV